MNTISLSCFLFVASPFSSSGYPNGMRATTLTCSGILSAFFTSSSLKAAIQQVPKPSLYA